MSVLKTIIVPLLTILILSGCSVKYNNVALSGDGRPQMQVMTPKVERGIRELAGSLLALSPNVNRAEAIEVAHDAYAYPLFLADKWNLTWPPMYHNTLRNSGARKWGLCTDWAKAMVDHMRKKNLRTFDIYWAVAFKGDPWREHSTLLLTAKGQPFDTGIILDPWRNSGKLYWAKHVKDPTYIWKYHAGPFAALPAAGPRQARRIYR